MNSHPDIFVLLLTCQIDVATTVNETPGSLTGMLKLNMKAEGGMIFGEGFVQLSAFIFHLF